MMHKNEKISKLSNTVTNWLVTEMIDTEKKIDLYLDEYKFNEAANEIYKFATPQRQHLPLLSPIHAQRHGHTGYGVYI